MDGAHLMHSPAIEWYIAKRTSVKDAWRYHVEGAQSVFSRPTAEKIIKTLGAGWTLRHVSESKQEQ